MSDLLLNPEGWALAIVHIILVLRYAKSYGWGEIEKPGFGSTFAVPGGAQVLSPAWIEFCVGFLTPQLTPTGQLDAVIGVHMLRVRMLAFVIYGLPVLYHRYRWGFLRLRCMDNRLVQQAQLILKNFASIHGGACGAFDTITLMGFMPGVVVTAVLTTMGVDVPLWIGYAAMVPFVFLLAKHFQWVPAQVFSDLLEISEIPGLIFASVIAWVSPRFFVLNYERHRHE